MFVTSSGTGVGKTYVTTALARGLGNADRPVQVLKPVISGFTDADFPESDTAVLLAALGLEATPENIDAMSPWRFAAPLSPDMAAARESRNIDFERLVAFCRDRVAGHDGITLVEGVGGVMVPLTGSQTVIDWIAALDCPALLVVGSYLGTLSHTLTAHGTLAARGIDVSAVIVSESEDNPVDLTETVDCLKRFLPQTRVYALARGDNGFLDDKAFLDSLGAK